MFFIKVYNAIKKLDCKHVYSTNTDQPINFLPLKYSPALAVSAPNLLGSLFPLTKFRWSPKASQAFAGRFPAHFIVPSSCSQC